MFNTLLFTCAICDLEIRDYPKRTNRWRQVAPVCSYCQQVWQKEPGHGAMMDRRITAQIGALASCLSATSHQKQNPLHWRNQ